MEIIQARRSWLSQALSVSESSSRSSSCPTCPVLPSLTSYLSSKSAWLLLHFRFPCFFFLRLLLSLEISSSSFKIPLICHFLTQTFRWPSCKQLNTHSLSMGKKFQFARWLSSRDVLYSIVPLGHNTVLHTGKCVSIESVMPSNHLILCHPLLLLPCFSHQ